MQKGVCRHLLITVHYSHLHVQSSYVRSRCSLQLVYEEDKGWGVTLTNEDVGQEEVRYSLATIHLIEGGVNQSQRTHVKVGSISC